jgi:putative MATE family efflux protein
MRERSGTFQSILDAVRGTDEDFSTGALGRSILLLAVPMVLEMVMESVFAIVDVFFVAKLGPDAVATVGLTESLLTIVYTVGMGLGIGATAVVARRIGERDPEGASYAAAQAIVLGVAISAVISVVGVLYAPDLLRLMGATEEVVATGSGFTRVMLGSNVVVVLLFLINAIFRGAGDAAIAMRVLWLANGVNVVLVPMLIFGVGPFPELGVTGAAVATAIGRGTGVLFALWRLFHRDSRVTLRPRHFALRPDLISRLLHISSTATFQVFVGMASWIGLVRLISTFGSEAVAGYTIGIRIVLFALFPSAGLANAAATLVGQSLGAGDPQRAERAVWKAGLYNMYFLGAVGLIFVLFAEPIVAIFTAEPTVAGYAVECLRIVALGFVFYAYGMVLEMSFNGAGDTWTPTVLNLVIFWLWEIPLAWVLAVPLGLGPRGVFVAITVAFSTLAVSSAVLFRRGRWKTRVV